MTNAELKLELSQYRAQFITVNSEERSMHSTFIVGWLAVCRGTSGEEVDRQCFVSVHPVTKLLK